MGCHTCFYNKIKPQPTYEEVRLRYINALNTEKGFYERHLSGTLSIDEAWLFDDESNNSLQKSKHYVEIFKRIIRRIEGKYCKVATMKHWTYYGNNNWYYCNKNNLIYSEIKEMGCDLFRIGKYCKDELLSIEDALEFFERRNNDIFWGYGPGFIGKETVIEKTREFYNKYPNGLIIFS